MQVDISGVLKMLSEINEPHQRAQLALELRLRFGESFRLSADEVIERHRIRLRNLIN